MKVERAQCRFTIGSDVPESIDSAQPVCTHDGKVSLSNSITLLAGPGTHYGSLKKAEGVAMPLNLSCPVVPGWPDLWFGDPSSPPRPACSIFPDTTLPIATPDQQAVPPFL